MINLIIRLILLHVQKNMSKNCEIPDCIICQKARDLFEDYGIPLEYPSFEEMMKRVKEGAEEFKKIPQEELIRLMEDNMRAMRRSHGRNLSEVLYITTNVLLKLGLDFPQAIDLTHENWFVLDVDWQIENDCF